MPSFYSLKVMWCDNSAEVSPAASPMMKRVPYEEEEYKQLVDEHVFFSSDMEEEVHAPTQLFTPA